MNLNSSDLNKKTSSLQSIIPPVNKSQPKSSSNSFNRAPMPTFPCISRISLSSVKITKYKNSNYLNTLRPVALKCSLSSTDHSKWVKEKYVRKLPMLSSELTCRFNKKLSTMKGQLQDWKVGRLQDLQK